MGRGARGPGDLRAPPVPSPSAAIARAEAAFAAVLSTVDMPSGFDVPWEQWSVGMAAALADLAAALETTPRQGGPGLRDVWTRIAALGCAIGPALPEPHGAAGERSRRFSALDAAAAAPDPASAMFDVLAAAEVLVGPVRPDPLAEPTRARFAAMSAAEHSPIAELVLGTPLPKDANELVDRKLSGNQVHNFAAFLSARWRDCDWIWGRLDAARALVEIVTRHHDGPFAAAEVRSLFLDGAADGWREFLEQRWETFGISDVDASAHVVRVVTERLQWEILAEEIPVLFALQHRAGEDLPPDTSLLTAASAGALPVEAGAVDGEGGGEATGESARDRVDAWTPERVSREARRLLGEVGKETIVDLLRKQDLRRVSLRVGLVVWRALLPAGRGSAWFGRRVLNAIEPVLWLPVLLALAAPLATFGAGLLTAVAIAFATDHPLSVPPDLFVLVGVTLAAASGRWQRAPEKSRKPQVLVVLGLAGAVLVALIVVWVLENPKLTGWSWEWRLLVVTALAIAASLLPLLRIPQWRGRPPRGRLPRRIGRIGAGSAGGRGRSRSWSPRSW